VVDYRSLDGKINRLTAQLREGIEDECLTPSNRAH